MHGDDTIEEMSFFSGFADKDQLGRNANRQITIPRNSHRPSYQLQSIAVQNFTLPKNQIIKKAAYSMLQVQEALHVTDSKVSLFSSCSDTVSALYLKQVFDLTPFVHKAFDKVSMTQEVLQD